MVCRQAKCQAKNRAEELCPCGKPTVLGKKRCRRCLKWDRRNSKKRYYMRTKTESRFFLHLRRIRDKCKKIEEEIKKITDKKDRFFESYSERDRLTTLTLQLEELKWCLKQ